MNTAVKEWLQHALRDLKSAELLISDPSLTASACFHSQQCIEKSFKAIIESKGDKPPKIHDLIRLFDIIGDLIDLEEDMLARLNEVYIDLRYPTGLGLLPEGTPSMEDAQQLLEFAKYVYDEVVAILQK